MRRLRRSLLLASILAAAPLSLAAPLPAQAQFSVSIGFDSFHGELAGYGDWLYSGRWGEVWRPMVQDRDPDWRPYWAGHWVFTDEYGWTWISSERPWGEIAYHYGRWVFDPYDGWLWLPGYVWSPAWVVWRSAGPDIGWMPMPPDEDFLRPGGISIGVSFGDWNDIGGYYGYSRWYGPDFDEARFGRLWTFVPGSRLDDPSFRRYALPRTRTEDIVRRSRNVTNYSVVNNVIVNRSVNIDVARGPSGRAPRPVRADAVLNDRRWIAPVNQGEEIQRRARQERPHGDGLAGSAPPPTTQQIRSLSTREIPERGRNNAAGNAPGGRSEHGGLFNRNNVAQFTAGQPARPNAQPQAEPNPRGGNDQNREQRNSVRPDNTPPANGRGDNRREAPQQPQAAPQPAPGAAPQQEQRNFGPDRNGARALERPDRQAPERAVPQAPPEPPAPSRQREDQTTPSPAQDRGSGPARNFERPAQPPAMEQRPQAQQRPERPAMEQRPSPPSPPPQIQQRPERPPEAARPNPPADRGQDRAPDRGRGRDERRGPDNRSDNNK